MSQYLSLKILFSPLISAYSQTLQPPPSALHTFHPHYQPGLLPPSDMSIHALVKLNASEGTHRKQVNFVHHKFILLSHQLLDKHQYGISLIHTNPKCLFFSLPFTSMLKRLTSCKTWNCPSWPLQFLIPLPLSSLVFYNSLTAFLFLPFLS